MGDVGGINLARPFVGDAVVFLRVLRGPLRFYIPNANVIVGTFWPTQCLDYAMTHISM